MEKSHKYLAIALSAVFVLSACSTGATPTTIGNETLAETKSPVQLLRNTAAGRVDPWSIAEVRGQSDGYAACFGEPENPDGLVRHWISSIDLVLVEDADLTAVAAALVDSFVDEGWDREDPSSGESFSLTILSSETLLAQVQVEASAESIAPIIKVTSTGPCVHTAGPDSEEVLNLEGN